MLVISMAVLILSFGIFSLYTFFTIRYRNGIKQPVQVLPAEVYPLVSILRPLRLVDDDVEKNLESLFLLDYPSYGIYFGVDAMTDPVVAIIEKLQSQYPHIPVKIIETGHSTTENPKIHKLSLMADQSNGQLYWVSDSNIRVEKDTLKHLVYEYVVNDSRIVFSPIRATGSQSIGSIIENAYINHFLSGNVISAWKLFKQQIVVGKSILIEKNTLDRFGGFSYFKDYLAEDYMMGATYSKSSYPISTNYTWVTNVNSHTSLAGFFSRMERWAKLRYNLRKNFYIMEFFVNPIILSLIFYFMLGAKRGTLVLLISLGLKIFLEMANFCCINHEDRKKLRVLLVMPLCILLKDVLLFVVYFTPFFSNHVTWRGGKISIGKDTLISASQEKLLFEGA